MSHDATNWAVKVRGISPAAKVVLWHLADRHNRDTGRCDPSQEKLSEDCEISRSSLNNQLRSLEQLGIISREKRLNQHTKRQKNTFYILNFEVTRPQDDVSRVQNLDTGAVSKFKADPCPNMSQSRVQYLDTNLVREPGNKPSTLTRQDGGDEVRNRILEILKAVKLDCTNAPLFHSAVEAELIKNGLSVQREYSVDDRGDGRAGRVDLVAMCSGGQTVGIECDRAAPRMKSITKLKQLDYGIIALRESGEGAALVSGISVAHCGVTPARRADARSGQRFGVPERVLQMLQEDER